MKVYQICYSTVKESFKSIIVVKSVLVTNCENGVVVKGELTSNFFRAYYLFTFIDF